MKLHLKSDSITIHAAENSSHYLHVSHILTHILGRSFWVNDTLINFVTPQNSEQRQAFLTSLYYACALSSKTHNASFLEKLLHASQKPIRLVKKRLIRPFKELPIDPYGLLNAKKTESLASIRKKYLTLAKLFHPDTIAQEDETSVKASTTKFQQIHEAYESIKAEKTKKIAA
jgi:hypothetical protein